MKELSDQDIYPLIYRYIGLEKGFDKVAKKFKKVAKIENQNSPIASLNLFQIVKEYLINNTDKQFKKSLKKYSKNTEKKLASDQQYKENEQGKQVQQNENVEDYQVAINGFQKTQQDNDALIQQYDYDQDQQQQQQQNQDDQKQDKHFNKREKTLNHKKKLKNSFTRISHKVEDIDKQSLKDNSFYAKKKFGHGDQFGELGQHMLGGRHGKQFKKQKTKLKNKNFQGAGQKLNLEPNSILL